MRDTILSIPVKRIKLGAQLFIAFSLVAYFFLFQRSSITDSIHHLRNFDLRWFALGIGLVLVDWVLAGTRIMLFAKRVYKPITFGASWRSCMVHVFLAGVTPSQTGGAAAQVYVLYLEGMKALDATVCCFVGGFITTVIVLLSGATFLIFRTDLLAPELRTLARISFGVYIAILAAIILTLTHPGGFKRVLRWLLTRIPKVRDTRAVARVSHTIDNYHDLMTGFFLRGKTIFFAGLVLTALIYVNKFLIGWVVLRGLGLEASVWQALYLQIIPLLIFYFSPTPGSSGLAEVSTMAALAPVLPKSYQAIYVLVWRFFTLLINMIVGAGVVMSYLSGKRGKRLTETTTDSATVAR
ncbi:MAG TPA: lysylphosphatidylglycerol synthase transmembrane domain-containing protein [Candidatus Krumholzibacteria bacterium]|nr:lysylphosphatidylglycerol synthase transmembrane domain-containing protein [Candidatus Krumholzibacteria bacterium]